jgi:hypothetical protein
LPVELLFPLEKNRGVANPGFNQRPQDPFEGDRQETRLAGHSRLGPHPLGQSHAALVVWIQERTIDP